MNNNLAPSTTPNPLDNLKDIHMPDAIGLWPLAPGWWVVIIVTSIALVFTSYLLFKFYRSTDYKRVSKKQLSLINEQAMNDTDYIKALNILLKQTALAVNSREKIARLSANAWLEFLDKHVENKAFSQGIGQVLGQGPYQAAPLDIDKKKLNLLITQWIKGLPRQC